MKRNYVKLMYLGYLVPTYTSFDIYARNLCNSLINGSFFNTSESNNETFSYFIIYYQVRASDDLIPKNENKRIMQYFWEIYDEFA